MKKHFKIKKIIFSVLFILFGFALYSQRTFVHPGLSHKKSDLDRMRAMVSAKLNPWYDSFINLSKEPGAKYTYVVRGNKSITKVVQDGENYSAITADVRASYLNSLMWIITGDERHAKKAVEILNAWQNLTNYQTTSTRSLESGRIGWILIEAAEIIAHTYDGWSQSDIKKFKEMLVYPGYSNTAIPNGTYTFYWNAFMGDSGRHGNQDLFGWRLVMAISVFTDNEIMFDRAFRYITNQKSRNDDLNYEPGPPITSPNYISTNQYFDTYNRSGQNTYMDDYGYNGVLINYIWENGQGQESSRDQDHAILGVGMLASIAEIAWNQGDDIYAMYNSRILTGYEWALRFNVSYKYPFIDQTSPWEPTGYTEIKDKATYENGLFIKRFDRSGRWFSKKPNPHYESNFLNISRGNFKSDKRPIYEVVYSHYKVRAGLSDESVKWTKRALDISNSEVGYEKSGWSLDHLGWGGLTCHRTSWMAGDPVSFISGEKVFSLPVVPCIIEAADYDYFTGNGQNRTYFDTSPGNTGNKYRSDDVDITESGDGYIVYNMGKGEWLSYTFETESFGEYVISVKHNTISKGSKLRAVFENGSESESELNVTSGYEEAELGTISLQKGVNVLRMYVTGESNITDLRSVIISKNQNSTSASAPESLNSADIATKDKTIFFQNLPQDTLLSIYTLDGTPIMLNKHLEPEITLPEKGVYILTAQSLNSVYTFKIIL